jgi:uracil-DNA glycosylase
MGEKYWGKPVPGFGDPGAKLLIAGLAPAAHGANRTGRIFTGDRSGDWLFAALFRAGFANQPTSVSRNDNLRLRDAWVTSVVKCAPPKNKPTITERHACSSFLRAEWDLLYEVRVVVALGAYGLNGLCEMLGVKPKLKFAHLAEYEVFDNAKSSVHFGETARSCCVVCSYHPSQQNTFTKKLSVEMFDAVFERARALLLDT